MSTLDNFIPQVVSTILSDVNQWSEFDSIQIRLIKDNKKNVININNGVADIKQWCLLNSVSINMEEISQEYQTTPTLADPKDEMRYFTSKEKTLDANFPKKSMSVVDLKKLTFNANENKVEYLLIDEKKLTVIYDAPKFWLFWYLGKECESKEDGKSWLQFPNEHLVLIDEIWLKWHKENFVKHLTGNISDYFDSEFLPRVNNINDLKNLVKNWDQAFLNNLDKLPGNKHKSWVIDIKGSNRRTIKSELIKPLKKYLKDSDKLFKKVSSSISHRPSPFKINTNLEIEISFKD